MRSSIPTQIPELDPSTLNENQKKFLLKFLQEKTDQTYFPTDEVHVFNGRQFKFKKPLLRRTRFIKDLPHPQVKYDVLSQKPIAKGGFGSVYDVEKSITLGKHSLRVKNDGKHVVKLTMEYKNQGSYAKFQIGSTSLEDIKLEKKLQERVGRFGPKKLQQHLDKDNDAINFLTTRKFKGQTLKAVINSDKMDVKQRLRLTIALLRALKEQVHDHGLIHRDIKPGNIIVDIDTMEINIIDLGLSVEKNLPDGKQCGTPHYISPEIMNNPESVDEKSDIFSMGRILAQVWRDDNDIWNKPPLTAAREIMSDQKMDMSKLFTKGCDLFLLSTPPKDKFKVSDKNNLYLYKDNKGIFYRINNDDAKQYLDNTLLPQELKDQKFDQPVHKPKKYDNDKVCVEVLKITSTNGHTTTKIEKPSPQVGNKIQSAIENMNLKDPAQRNTIDTLINNFHDAYLDECHPHAEQNNTQKLVGSFNEGIAARPELIKASNWMAFNAKLLAHLTKITDNEDAVREFTHGLGWHSLQNAKSKLEVYTSAMGIINQHHEMMKGYSDILKNSQILLRKYDIISRSEIFSELNEFILELKQKIDRIKKRPFDLDLLQEKSESLHDRYNSWNDRLKDVKKELSNDTHFQHVVTIVKAVKEVKKPLQIDIALSMEQKELPTVLDELKNDLRNALRKYMAETLTDKNIISRQRAASDHRSQDIKEFMSLINKSENKENLIQKTRERMSTMRTPGSFFGNSKLKSNLKDAIETHEKKHSRRHKS